MDYVNTRSPRDGAQALQGGIALVGMSGRFPGSSSVEEFWHNLCEERDALALPDRPAKVPSPSDDPEGFWVEANTLLRDADMFDAEFFGFSPVEATRTDVQHRLFLECAWEALEEAGWTNDRPTNPVAVFGGCNFSLYFNEIIEPGRFLDLLPLLVGIEHDHLPTRVSHVLGLSGPSHAVQCGCSTSLVAVHQACRALLNHECDAALAGGAAISTPRTNRHFHMKGGMLAPEGRVRAFDAHSQGTVFAEGVGVVLLMRLEDAIAQRRPMHAVILGTAVNNDADMTVGFTAPSAAGQERLLEAAYRNAGVSPAHVGYVEAHGTGTVVGDAVELTALTNVFRRATDRLSFCALGSVKTNVGHLAAAAGVAGLIKAALAVKHGIIPANLHFQEPHPQLGLEQSPFFVSGRTTSWPGGPGPRIAGVSSFGVGGTNAHVVLKEPPVARPSSGSRTWHLLPISARNTSALNEQITALAGHFQAAESADLSDSAFTLAQGRKAFDSRAVAICRDRNDAARQLNDRSDRLVSRRRPKQQPKIAFLFPGQGAQFAGMGLELHRQEPVFRRHANKCLDLLRGRIGVDLYPLLYASDAASPENHERLKQTDAAQPALFITEYSLARLLEAHGVQPVAAIGHSLGEYVAACLSGALSLSDALAIVAERGRLMSRLPRGAMLAASASEAELRHHLPAGVNFAGFNAPGQTVCSGPAGLIERLEKSLKRDGIAARRLQTSHAFHSEMMEPMLPEFARLMKERRIQTPTLPYASNVTGELVTTADLADPRYWTDHIRKPVQFSNGIRALMDLGIDHWVEVGPGRALISLAQQCGASRPEDRLLTTMPGPSDEEEPPAVLKTVASLWLSGADLDLGSRYTEERRSYVALPTYRFQRRRHWLQGAGEFGSSASERRTSEKKPIENWFYTPTWTRISFAENSHRSEHGDLRSLVFLPPGRDLDDLLGGLGDVCGIPVTVSPGDVFKQTGERQYQINPRSPEDYRALFAALGAIGENPERIVHFWTLAVDNDDLDDAQDAGVLSLQRILRELLAVFPAPTIEIVVVSTGLADVTGDEELCPANAGILGFSALATLEQPTIACRVIDADECGPALGREISASSDLPFVALRKGRRWRREVREERATQEGSRLRAGGVYLVLGGLGNLGSVVARHLATQHRAHLIVTGRNVPQAEAGAAGSSEGEHSRRLETLREIERNATSLLALAADVADESDMRRVRDAALERHGRIDGIFYAAGDLGLQLTGGTEESLKAYESHLSAKAKGVEVLDRVFGDLSVDFCLIFSSLANFAPVVGQWAYVSANQIADAIVLRHNRRSEVRWMTANWDLWANTSVWTNIRWGSEPDASRGLGEVEQRFADVAQRAITPHEGVRALETVLAMGNPQTIISTYDLAVRMERSRRGGDVGPEEEARSGEGAEEYGRPELDTPYVAPVGPVELQLAKIWGDTLGIGGIGRNDNFFDLGGHSLMAVRLVARMQTHFGIELRLDEIFASPWIAAVALVIDGLLTERIDQMSEEEAERLLSAAS